MKILIVSSSAEGGLGQSYLRAFSDFGAEAEIFDEEKFYRESGFFNPNRYFHRLFWRFLALPLQKEIIKKVVAAKPDLIFVIKGWLIKPETILEIKKILLRTLVFNFNPDNPFNTWHHGISNSWIRNSIPLYDAYLIWGKFLIEPLQKAGAKRVEYLAFGYDPKLHYPAVVTEKEKSFYGSDVAFVGSWDEEREKWLTGILDYDLKIWGNAWQKADKKLQEKWQRKEMTGEEFSKVCNASKIILNFIRKQNGSAHNMRTFETPACGGFVLATGTEEQKEFFAEGKEAEYFGTPEELRQKISFYLKNEESRKKIAEAGREKLLGAGYSYRDRAKRILELFDFAATGR